MNTEVLDTLKTVVDTVKAAVDTTLVNVAPVVEKTIWQDKSLMTVFAVIGGILLLGAIFIFLDIRSDRKEKKEKRKNQINKFKNEKVCLLTCNNVSFIRNKLRKRY